MSTELGMPQTPPAPLAERRLSRQIMVGSVPVGGGAPVSVQSMTTTLTANVVVTAIQKGALQMQIDATRQLIDFNTKMVEILRYQVDKGYASGVDLAAQESQLAQVSATLPPLLKQSAQLDHLLARLRAGPP